MQSAIPADAVCITGLGMVASLGYDVATVCAAARAGIVRPAELDYFPVRSPEDGEIAGVIGHPVPELTRGFEGFARLLRIAQAGLADLQRQAPHAPWISARTAFYLSLADPRREYTGLALIQDEESRQGREEEAQEAEQESPDEDMGLPLLQTAAQLTGWPGESFLRFVTTSGHTGAAEAICEACKDLHEGRVEAAIIGGVDSLLEEDTLVWLESTSRLKTPSVPAGLQPGEAGAFLLLETAQGAKTRGGRLFGVVQDVRLGKESKSLLSGDPPTGTGLTEVLTGIMGGAGWQDIIPVWLITDQNGEPYRATEWGNTIVRLVARSRAFTEPMLWHPAASVGETGAASGAVSLCIAARAFTRGYAPARTVAVLSSADSSLRAAVLIKMPDN